MIKRLIPMVLFGRNLIWSTMYPDFGKFGPLKFVNLVIEGLWPCDFGIFSHRRSLALWLVKFSWIHLKFYASDQFWTIICIKIWSFSFILSVIEGLWPCDFCILSHRRSLALWLVKFSWIHLELDNYFAISKDIGPFIRFQS